MTIGWSVTKTWIAAALALGLVVAVGHDVFAQGKNSARMTSTVFSGAKVNDGTVTFSREGDHMVLTVSSNFKVPDTPDPHWQVVDSKGNVFLLQRLTIKGDKVNTSITLPTSIKDVAKVQIWCAWAEALLGEASFEKPVS